MGINIKNLETVQLIRELAARTGMGQTEAITVAVQEALDRLKGRGLAERLMEIGRETAPLMKDFNWDEALYGENGLYDRETGLPK
ncbi:MAG: type II toxin-antitoxin system VapB family antitoxin [Bauldia sp.]